MLSFGAMLSSLLGKRPVTVGNLLTLDDMAQLLHEFQNGDMTNSESLIILYRQHNGWVKMGLAGPIGQSDFATMRLLAQGMDLVA